MLYKKIKKFRKFRHELNYLKKKFLQKYNKWFIV